MVEVLRKRADFLAANRGSRIARPGFVMLARANCEHGIRYGITVTRKIGNAVVRNRIKRRFRVLLREALPHHGLANHDYVMIARAGCIDRDFALLRNDLELALGRLARGESDPPRRVLRRRKGGGPNQHKNTGKRSV